MGLHFEYQGVSEKRHLVISGDTAWTSGIARVYQDLAHLNPILVAHVSSARKQEATGILRLAGGGHYDKHLCIWGTAEMINTCKPSKVILSEIGEELKEVIHELAERMEAAFGIPCLVGMLDDANGGEVSLL